MLDHVFTDAIGALRDALEAALLERLTAEERYQVDVLLGDSSWDTSYGLPGEGSPARVRADITLDWPTWSQTAFRSWTIDGELGEVPSIAIAVVFRLQGLAHSPDPALVLRALPEVGPSLGKERLERRSPTVETNYDRKLRITEYAIEITFECSYDIPESTLEDGAELDAHFAVLGGWIASCLVALGDLPLTYDRP